MTASPEDTVTLESDNGASFEIFTSLDVLNSMVRSSEANFEFGDDGTYNELQELTRIGAAFKVTVNGRQRVSGRLVLRNSPISAEQSSVVRATLRTKLADIEYAAADPRVRVKGRSIKEVIEAVLKSQGIEPSAIEYRADVSREIITGRRAGGARAPKNLEPLKEDQAAVQPMETVKAFLDRHLRRHGLMIWDSPDGKLVISEPDDDQDSLFVFRCFRGAEAQGNNVISIDRTEDGSTAPTSLNVYGFGGGRDFRRAKVSAARANDRFRDGEFFRPLLIVDEGVRRTELAERTAAREFSERIRRMDFLIVTTDGLSFREAQDLTPYAPDCCADVFSENLGGALGKYYVEQTLLRRTPNMGSIAELQVVKAGTWVL